MTRLRTNKTLSEHHIDDLIDVLSELLAVPELRCFSPDEMFDTTRETMAKARVIRSAVLDEMMQPYAEASSAPMEGAL